MKYNKEIETGIIEKICYDGEYWLLHFDKDENFEMFVVYCVIHRKKL